MRTVRWLVLIGAASAVGQGWPTDWAGAPVRNVVTGTGDPNLDIAAVQAAVDQGGQVLLRGHFSFDRPPAKSTPPLSFFPRMANVVVSKEVAISGASDFRGGMARVDGGTWPFAVEAPRARVTIRGLRFVRPKAGAIQVNAVSGLTIADCRIEGIDPVANPDMKGVRVGMGIGISTNPIPPTPEQPGQPENVSGILSIANNSIDVAGGAAGDDTIGVLIFAVGTAGNRAVDVFLTGNGIRNV